MIPLNRVFLIYVPGSVLIFAQLTAESDVPRSVSKTIDSPSFREKSRLSRSVARTARSVGTDSTFPAAI